MGERGEMGARERGREGEGREGEGREGWEKKERMCERKREQKYKQTSSKTLLFFCGFMRSSSVGSGGELHLILKGSKQIESLRAVLKSKSKRHDSLGLGVLRFGIRGK